MFFSSSVVVTGVGAVTPLGGSAEELREGLMAGKDASGPVTLFDVAGCRCQCAAEAQLPPPTRFTKKELARLPRASRLAIPAAAEALAMARLLDANGRCFFSHMSLSVSTTGGGMAFGEDFLRHVLARKRRGKLGTIARYQPQQQVLDLQNYFGMSGHSVILANACASGANAVGHAADLIRSGAAECVLTGGFEALTELIFVGFDCLKASSPEKCRPFDVTRSGLILGEAAAFLVLETAAHAARRGIEPLCQLAGYGHATDLHHLTQPAPDGGALVRALTQATRQGNIAPHEIAYLNAHGTGTPMNDAAEAAAFRTFFGERWPRISSTKASIGHTLGAAGAVEAVIAVQTLIEKQAPPQINLQNPMPEMGDSLPRRGEMLPDARAVASVNLGFGGSNAALVFART
ncbi:MAG: beta-ketoacyl-[acyl-carrier-protein] synthase family protein [bacterium]